MVNEGRVGSRRGGSQAEIVAEGGFLTGELKESEEVTQARQSLVNSVKKLDLAREEVREPTATIVTCAKKAYKVLRGRFENNFGRDVTRVDESDPDYLYSAATDVCYLLRKADDIDNTNTPKGGFITEFADESEGIQPDQLERLLTQETERVSELEEKLIELRRHSEGLRADSRRCLDNLKRTFGDAMTNLEFSRYSYLNELVSNEDLKDLGTKLFEIGESVDEYLADLEGTSMLLEAYKKALQQQEETAPIVDTTPPSAEMTAEEREKFIERAKTDPGGGAQELLEVGVTPTQEQVDILVRHLPLDSVYRKPLLARLEYCRQQIAGSDAGAGDEKDSQ